MGLTTGVVSAATTATTITGTGDALKVSPVRQDLTIKPGASQTIDVFVQNLSSQTANLQVIVNDFTASSDESGAPDILLSPNSYAPSHGLKRYVQPISDITLKPNEQKDVKVTVAIPGNAGGGGYFGAVRFAPATDNGNSKSVSLSGSVGSLILVTVPGNITEQMSVAGFGAGKSNTVGTFFTSKKGLETIARFRDTGNVQLEPFGKVELKKSGKVLATYEINNSDPRGNVLPDSIRRFTVPLTNLGSFGKYTLDGNFGYGSKGQLITASATFYIVPGAAIIAAVVVLLSILFLIFVLPRMIRSHDQRVVRQVMGGSGRSGKKKR
jgi:hypothetical protein